jgi:DNA polymerase III subunit delta'
MDYLSANSLPWLAETQERLRAAHAAGRLPPALLLVSPGGLGAELLAAWASALALCESAEGAPCGVCASCVLLRADTHPDVHVVRLLEDAQQIKVDQIRELIEALALSSYRGGYKVAVVEDAEALNANGANAFLKTLEEPSGKSLLILIAKPSHRLPATISSRCQRITLRAPARDQALAWLEQHAPGAGSGGSGGSVGSVGSGSGGSGGSWEAALALAGGAPLLALQLPRDSIVRLDQEMREALQRLAADSIDVSVLADAWARSDWQLKLVWLENWITRRVQAELGSVDSLQSAEPVRLPAALLKPKIRALFELLDSSRELRRLGSTGLNQQLALESLLLRGKVAIEKSK